MNPLHIVILAAGKGTRMYSSLPKVLHRIGGKAMLQHVIDTAEQLQPQAISVVIGHGRKQIAQHIHAPHINWVVQEQQLGTGHALQVALPHLTEQGQTLVLYGDVPLIDHTTLTALIDTAQDGIGLLTDHLPNPTGYGRIIRQNGQVQAIVEEKDANTEQKNINEINTGILVLPNRHLRDWLGRLSNQNAQGEYYLTDLIGMAVGDGVPVRPLPVRASHLAAGVNNRVQLAELERQFQAQQAQTLLQQGLCLLDPARFDLRGTLQHGQDVVIDVNVILEGEIQLADNVQIGAHCVLKNVRIGAGSRIEPFSHLEGCNIGNDARIGPYARIRPQTELADAVHIGNFVEVKNSRIENGSKANHLSYIGDADIGQNSNIGAGTITANYDGVHKHRTVIGERVRIGSDTVLVAPVHVGDGATTGAGSVITRDCPPDKLTLARSRQSTIDNWRRPEKEGKKA